MMTAASTADRVTTTARGYVECPLCSGRFAAFEPAGSRPGAICPGCGSRERHRALWLFFEQRPGLLRGARSLLHFAPEPCVARHLADVPGLRYITADLDARRADLPLDLTDVKLPDDAFDAAVCSHVLEHVPDDRAAMRELHRIIKPGGWVLVMVPLDITRTETYEDFSITEPEERRRLFGLPEHVRRYAPDIADRLRDAGFAVDVAPVADRLGAESQRRHGLLRSDHVFLCRKESETGR